MPKDAAMSFYTVTNREFAEQNAGQAVWVANCGMNFLREVAEQNVEQSKMLHDSLLTTTKKVIDDFDHRLFELRHRSMLLAEETLSNTFDFAHKAVRAKEPQELARLQNEFTSRQVRTFLQHTKELGDKMMQQTNELAKTATRDVSKGSQAQNEAA